MPDWKTILKKIINKGKIKNNKNNEDLKYNENLSIIKDAIKNKKISLSNTLDIILDNIPSLKTNEEKQIFLLEIYKKELSLEQQIKNKEETHQTKISLKIRSLIDQYFNNIVTTNYDDIFNFSNKKEIKVNWKIINKKIKKPQQKNKKWIYPLHGTIISNGNKNTIIDTYLSFITEWKNNNLATTFKKFLKNCINQNYIFLFIGYSFNDNFVLNELASFILKNITSAKKEISFYILWDDIDEKNLQIDKTKFFPLSKVWEKNVTFLKLSEFSKNKNILNILEPKYICISNFFNQIDNSLKEIKNKNFYLKSNQNIKHEKFKNNLCKT